MGIFSAASASAFAIAAVSTVTIARTITLTITSANEPKNSFAGIFFYALAVAWTSASIWTGSVAWAAAIYEFKASPTGEQASFAQ